MRFSVIAIVANFLLLASPANACRDGKDTIFFDKRPEPKFKVEVFVKVVLGEGESARVTRVFKAPRGSIRKGDRVLLKYRVTSCGPRHDAGEKGNVWAKLSVNEQGQKILHLYTRQFGEDRAEPPEL